MNNGGQVVFPVLDGTDTKLATRDATSCCHESAALSAPLRPQISDHGRIVVRAGNLTTDPIRLYAKDLQTSRHFG